MAAGHRCVSGVPGGDSAEQGFLQPVVHCSFDAPISRISGVYLGGGA